MEKKINQKLIYDIAEGVLLMLFGIIIAVFGGGEALNIYLGIVALMVGLSFGALVVLHLRERIPLTIAPLFGVIGSLVLGLALLTGWLNLGVLLDLLVFAVIAFGISLVLYGVYTILKINLYTGIGQIVVGFVVALLAVLFLTVQGFAAAFWLILGIIVALAGLALILMPFFGKKLRIKKE